MNLITKLISVLLFSLTLLLSAAPAAEASEKISEGSGIAGIPLEGLTREEAKLVLQQEIDEWQRMEPMEAESDYETLYIPRELFVFDIDAAVDELMERTKREWSNLFIPAKNVKIPLEVDLVADYETRLTWSENINVENTLEKAARLASQLMEGNILIEYKESATLETVELAQVQFFIPEELSIPTVLRLVEEINEISISPEETFSFLDEMILPEGMPNSEAEMSLVASGLYELALYTELEVIERHAAASLPAFTEPGREAMVDQEKEDNLLLYHPGKITYALQAEVADQELFMSIHAANPEHQIEVFVENEKEIPPRTIYRYNEELLDGEEQIITAGTPGLQFELHRQIAEQNDSAEDEAESELVSRNFYPPEHRVVHVSYLVEEEEMEEEEEEGELETEEVETAMERIIAACFTEQLPETETETDPAAVTSEDEETETQQSSLLCDLVYLNLLFGPMHTEEIHPDDETVPPGSEAIPPAPRIPEEEMELPPEKGTNSEGLSEEEACSKEEG